MSETTKQEIVAKTFTANGVSFDMMLVEVGTYFIMGATSDLEERHRIESPEHIVKLTKDYYIGKTQVTQELWTAVMGSNPSQNQGKKKPVESVTWNQCQEFIEKLNEATGMNFRLPTEAEWEYAAHGGKNTHYYEFSGSNDINEVAWNSKNSRKTKDVAKKLPNELGIYDMTGNVKEWCSDWFSWYKESIQTDPVGTFTETYGSRIVRGSSYNMSKAESHNSYRYEMKPGYFDNSIGLRLALSE